MNWLQDDTSGDYREVLLALIGARPAPQPTAEEQDIGEPELEEIEEEHIEVHLSPFNFIKQLLLI